MARKWQYQYLAQQDPVTDPALSGHPESDPTLWIWDSLFGNYPRTYWRKFKALPALLYQTPYDYGNPQSLPVADSVYYQQDTPGPAYKFFNRNRYLPGLLYHTQFIDNPVSLAIADAVYYQTEIPLSAYIYKHNHFRYPYIPTTGLWDALATVLPGINPYKICVDDITAQPYAHLAGFQMPVGRLIRAYDNKAAEPLPCRCLTDECGST